MRLILCSIGFCFTAFVAAPTLHCFAQEQELDVDELEFELQAKELKQEMELYSREQKLTEQRLNLLTRIRLMSRELRHIEQQIEALEDKGQQNEVEALQKRLHIIEVAIESNHGRMEVVKTRQELARQHFEAIRDSEQEAARQLQQLFPLLDKWNAYIDRIQSALEAGNDDVGERLLEELESIIEAVEIRREIVGIGLELSYAEEDGEKELARELRDELQELHDALARFPDSLKPKDEQRDSARPKEKEQADLSKRLPVKVNKTAIAQVADLRIQHVMPLLNRFCIECHADGAYGDLNIEVLSSQLPLVRNRQHWINILEQIRNRSMPPADAQTKPTEPERLKLVAWIHTQIHDFDYATVAAPGYEPVRRLTHQQYNNAIRDLFGVDLRPADRFPTELAASSGFNNSANSLFLNALLMERYLNTTEWLIDEALPAIKTTEQHNQTYELVFSESGEPDDASQVLQRFVTRAWRRRPTADELGKLNRIVAGTTKTGASKFDSVKKAIAISLVSPNFLMISESSSGSEEVWQVSDWDLASRLSLFLWSSIPDDRLHSMAETSQLHDRDKLFQTVDRMLDDPKANALGTVFAAQWLGSQFLGKRVRADPIDNPWCTETLMSAMRSETSLFFLSLIRDDLPLEQLINGRYTYLNEELAGFYGIDGVHGEKMQRIELSEDNPRGGIFGQAALLAVTSFPGRASPVVRGRWILGDVLGTPPPPPPPNVSELSERLERARGLSMREKLELHRRNPNCYACHSQIDPLGFGLQQFDWFGRWRSSDRIDPSGQLPDGSRFRGPKELKNVIVQTRLDDLATNVARKMLSFGLGRQLEYFDEAAVQKICDAWKKDDYRMRSLVKQIVISYPFQYKQRPSAEK